MRLRLLSLTVTDDCNFACRYCYQLRRARRMTEAVARTAVDLFLPLLAPGGFISFYGGEPLLEVGLIRETVAAARRAGRRAGIRPRFALTTNGSLIDEETFGFLERERFAVTLSFDGAGQDVQRKAGSRTRLLSLIDRMAASPRLRFEVNSVYTPRSVGSLAEDVLGLVARGVPLVHFALAAAQDWTPRDLGRLRRQADRLRADVIGRYGRLDRGPVDNFRDEAALRIRACNAGRDRLAVDTRGRIWGCALFADLDRAGGGGAVRRGFSFGTVRRPALPGGAAFRRAAGRYEMFAMDRAATARGPCYQCPDVVRCWVCPVQAEMAGGSWTAIPEVLCRLRKACWAGLR
ncbi:MAG: radical SAM protein [Candidatus Aminicenantes bacterium]|nr:radical SAM protein [Candidatus Aminicenantes bacterium]